MPSQSNITSGMVIVASLKTIFHTFWKLGASLSLDQFGEERSSPSWYMYVLAHANIFVSLNYMNIVLYKFPSVRNEEIDPQFA